MEIKNLSEIMEAISKLELQNEDNKTKTPDVDIFYKIDDNEDLSIEKMPEIDEYGLRKRLRLIYDSSHKMTLDHDTRKIVQEARAILALRNEKVDKMVNEDIDELEKCLNANAYKAVLIMAGSVLEAVLLDWLSEKDGVDYFSRPFRYHGQKTIKLEDYINAIPELEVPDWMNKNAHQIRLKRNLVHAKLQFKEEANIDAEMCSKVIGYLRDVIKKRQEYSEI
jgi:hypothetical protein